MPGTDERRRHDLYLAFEAVIGPEPTDTLMGLLPPVGTELATRQDLALTRAQLRGEMAELRTEMAELRTELRAEMAELRTEMAELRTELRTEMAELRTDVANSLRDQTRTLLLGMVGSMASMSGVVVGAIALTA